MKSVHGGNIWEASRRSGEPPEKIIDFSASINPMGLSPLARRYVLKALKLVSPYPDPDSALLRQAISGYHGVSPDEVLPGNGSTEFIYLIPGALAPRKALIVEPAFSEYRRSLISSGCRVESFILREAQGWAIDTERLKARLRRGYGLVYVANPANPTGALTKKEALLDAARVCRACGTFLVVDEAFIDFTEGESIKKEAVRLENVIVLRSMTKFFAMAGLRLGFLIANSATVRRFASLMAPWSVNTLASAAGIGALEDKAYMEKTRRWLAREKAFLEKGLSMIPGLKSYPSPANFFMSRIETGACASGLNESLFKKGIIIRDLSGFRGLGPDYFRAAVKKRHENELLLRRLKNVLKG